MLVWWYLPHWKTNQTFCVLFLCWTLLRFGYKPVFCPDMRQSISQRHTSERPFSCSFLIMASLILRLTFEIPSRLCFCERPDWGPSGLSRAPGMTARQHVNMFSQRRGGRSVTEMMMMAFPVTFTHLANLVSSWSFLTVTKGVNIL